MKTKAPLPLTAFEGRELSPLLEAYLQFNHLKHLYRQGWLRRGISPEECESVAEHIFAMALLAWWAAEAYDPALDTTKIIRMVLVHELGEIYAGDIIPADEVPPAEKHSLERAAVERVTRALPGGDAILALWEEYEQAASPEAVFVKQVDRLEMALQALVYESQGVPRMAEFFGSASAAVSDPRLRALLDEALSQRDSGHPPA